MASIRILNKIYKSLPPNSFIQANTTNSIIVGGISKFVTEHTLLKYEFMFYGNLLIPALGIFASSNATITTPFYIGFPILCGLYIIPYYIPLHRTYNAIVNKNIQIINLNE